MTEGLLKEYWRDQVILQKKSIINGYPFRCSAMKATVLWLLFSREKWKVHLYTEPSLEERAHQMPQGLDHIWTGENTCC